MDLRFEVFELIARDEVLRRLLVNYADRLDGRPCDGTCYLALQWTDSASPDAPVGAQALTARVHLPRERAGEQAYLDVVLRRLDAALARATRSGSVVVRRTEPGEAVVEHGADTVYKTRVFEFAAEELTRS